jgi:hypothetical protein
MAFSWVLEFQIEVWVRIPRGIRGDGAEVEPGLEIGAGFNGLIQFDDTNAANLPFRKNEG